MGRQMMYKRKQDEGLIYEKRGEGCRRLARAANRFLRGTGRLKQECHQASNQIRCPSNLLIAPCFHFRFSSCLDPILSEFGPALRAEGCATTLCPHAHVGSFRNLLKSGFSDFYYNLFRRRTKVPLLLQHCCEGTSRHRFNNRCPYSALHVSCCFRVVRNLFGCVVLW